ncbi:MAG: DUF2382 domain-containing protein [Pseudonocardiaceae bacterium]
MLTIQQVRNLQGATVYDADGNKIGKIGQIYLDDQTGHPEWVAVRTGLFGTHESFVPLAQADMPREGEVVVPVSKAQVKDAPRIDPVGGHLSGADEVELYRYYELEPEPSSQTRRPVGQDISGPTTDDAMTRSEERMRVGVEQRETGRVRLRKYVVTEEIQQPVQVSHEEVRIEREPITAENRDRAVSGPAISEEEHEVTLYAERPVVQTEVTPVERVRLAKDTVRDEETVRGEVRKEQIETEIVDERNRSS